MDEVVLVCVLQRRSRAGADVRREFWREALLCVEQLAQALAIDELHHHGLATLMLEHVMNGDDIRVVEARCSDCLAPEAFRNDFVRSQCRLEPLDCDLPVQREVDGEPDLGHTTLSQAAFELVTLGDQR